MPLRIVRNDITAMKVNAIVAYIDNHYVDVHTDSQEEQRRRAMSFQAVPAVPMEEELRAPAPCGAAPGSLNEALFAFDQSLLGG